MSAASPSISVHAPAAWTFTLGGIQVEDFSDGDFVVITPPADGFKHVIGAQGDILITMSPDKVWSVKFSLFERSRVNDALDAFYGVQRYKGLTGQPIGSAFTAFDPISGRTWRAAASWIPAIPPTTPGGKREWMLSSPMTVFPGTVGV